MVFLLLSSQVNRQLSKISIYSNFAGGDFPKRLDKSLVKCVEFFNCAIFPFVPSGYMKKQLSSRGDQHVKMISNQNDFNKFWYKERVSVDPNSLWLRSFNRIYNPRLAIEILKKVLKKYPTNTISMVGLNKDGSLTIEKEKVKEDGLDNYVSFPGKMTRKEGDWLFVKELWNKNLAKVK